MADSIILKICIVVLMLSVSVQGLQNEQLNSKEDWDPQCTPDLILAIADKVDNNALWLQEENLSGVSKFNQPHMIGTIPNKRGNKAGLIGMVDYVNKPEGGTSDYFDVKPKASLDSRVWKTMLGRK